MDIEIETFSEESVYWVNMNEDINNTVKQCGTCLEYQQTQPHKKTVPYEILCKPWEKFGADFFLLNIAHFCALVD